ncbi:MAG: hypothetical protein A4E31_01434 [Methanomassiliicoccales archaeon PtaU1.Bin030]|nr:MAG: hypothetical protein A4E31_01434 [Methanomassiliicoccales archaeon PtaU1.Bin030]
MKDVIVVGSGFGGLAQAALLAKDGHKVRVFEKNEQPGGRASVYSEKGYTFDMGPSWYLMPDVFERYFQEFGKRPSELFDLVRLDPSYRIFFGDRKQVDISSELEANYALFDTLEEGGGDKLRKYLDESREKYEVAIKELLYRDYNKLTDFLDRRLLAQGRKLHLFENLDSFVNKHFKSDEAKKIVEYSVGFLGGSPKNTPSFYHIMSHIDFNLGVWYPRGGMREIVAKMVGLCKDMGVELRYNEPVTKLEFEGRKVRRVVTPQGSYSADIVVMNADYAHSELELVDPKHRSYSERYWENRVLAPSAMVAYLGIRRKVEQLVHHNLFLDEDWANGFDAIFDRNNHKWPDSPSYYVNVPSRTDPTAAPEGCDTLFVLIPLSTGLEDTPEQREAFYDRIMDDLERKLGTDIRSDIEVKRIFALGDFKERYNAYEGTALGLSHTLGQTALFRPVHRSKKVDNLYYTGHYCHPGIGVPMVLISSQIVRDLIAKGTKEA